MTHTHYVDDFVDPFMVSVMILMVASITCLAATVWAGEAEARAAMNDATPADPEGPPV